MGRIKPHQKKETFHGGENGAELDQNDDRFGNPIPPGSGGGGGSGGAVAEPGAGTMLLIGAVMAAAYRRARPRH